MDNTFQIVKTALAAALSWWLVFFLLHGPYPYFAPLAAILTVQATIAESVKKSSQRLVGTIGGVIISVIITHWLPIGTASIFIVVVTGMAIGSFLRLPSYINSQAAVSSLMVLAFSQSQGYALGRVIETVVGSFVGVLVNAIIVPPNAIPKAEKQISVLSEQASSTLASLGYALPDKNIEASCPSIHIAGLVKATINGIHSIQLAEESMRINPLMKKQCKRLTELTTAMRHLEHISVQIRGIRRGILDLFDTVSIDIEFDKLKSAIDLTAACINAYGISVVEPSDKTAQRLSRSMSEAKEAQSNCYSILLKADSLTLVSQVGAIITDLQRILEETAFQNSIK